MLLCIYDYFLPFRCHIIKHVRSCEDSGSCGWDQMDTKLSVRETTIRKITKLRDKISQLITQITKKVVTINFNFILLQIPGNFLSNLQVFNS